MFILTTVFLPSQQECRPELATDGSISSFLECVAGSKTFQAHIWEKQPMQWEGLSMLKGLISLQDIARAGLKLGSDNWFTNKTSGSFRVDSIL